MTHLEVMAQHEQIVRGIQQERALEFSQAATRRQLQAAHGAERETATRKAMKAMGMDFSKLEALDHEREAQGEQSIQSLRAQLAASPQRKGGMSTELDLSSALAPKGSVILRPSWGETFSEVSPQTESLDLNAQDVIPGGGYGKYYNWASGAGSGLFGTGVGENQSWVEFGGWFRPTENRFYSIVPHFQFRGFYIVQADDAWYDSKYARVVVSCWTNVYQYNWKGWNAVNVLDVGRDNINVNDRFDADRYPYSSYLLGADWAFVRCTIGLYTYARGGGSYALNDYNAGDANYLGVPEIYIS